MPPTGPDSDEEVGRWEDTTALRRRVCPWSQGFVESQEGPRFFHKTSFARDGRDTRPPPSHLGKKRGAVRLSNPSKNTWQPDARSVHTVLAVVDLPAQRQARSDVYMIIIWRVESGESRRVGTCLFAC